MKNDKTNLINLLNIGKDIFVFAITGGPCSGKTTGMARMKEWFEERGYKVFVVPESATNIIGAGLFYGKSALTVRQFQEVILQYGIMQEQLIFSSAMKYRDQGQKVVILCDRGLLDGEAYAGEQDFSKMLSGLEFTHEELSNHRYHGVFHLRTTALGAEEHFTLANNSSRTEDLEGARTLDHRTLYAWRNHAHVRVIDNGTDFDTKIRRLFVEVSAVIGDPVPLEKERKFRVKAIILNTIPVQYAVVQITQTYLQVSENRCERVRTRETKGGVSYYHTIKTRVSVGQSFEEERIISEHEYKEFLLRKDESRSVIVKNRAVFHWKNEFFELDAFSLPAKFDMITAGEFLLEVERASDSLPGTDLMLPDFLEVIEEVTGNPKYSNDQIALIRP